MRRILLVAVATTALVAGVRYGLTTSWLPPPAVMVRVGAHQAPPSVLVAKPTVDLRYLPVGCDGRVVTDVYGEGPRRSGVRMGCGPRFGRVSYLGVKQVMDDGRADLETCWPDGDEAKISVRFIIGTDGSAGHIRAGADPLTRACIERTLHGLRFPIPDGGPVMVSYPLHRPARP